MYLNILLYVTVTPQILFELRNKDPELIHHDYGFIEVRKIVKNIEFNL